MEGASLPPPLTKHLNHEKLYLEYYVIRPVIHDTAIAAINTAHSVKHRYMLLPDFTSLLLVVSETCLLQVLSLRSCTASTTAWLAEISTAKVQNKTEWFVFLLLFFASSAIFYLWAKQKRHQKNDVSLLYNALTLLIALHTVEGILESYSFPNVCLAALLYNIADSVFYLLTILRLAQCEGIEPLSPICTRG